MHRLTSIPNLSLKNPNFHFVSYTASITLLDYETDCHLFKSIVKITGLLERRSPDVSPTDIEQEVEVLLLSHAIADLNFSQLRNLIVEHPDTESGFCPFTSSQLNCPFILNS